MDSREDVRSVKDYKIATVLLLGSNGQLGSALRRKWSQEIYQQKLCVVASHHEALDISNAEAVERTLDQISPDIVINCAGFNGQCNDQGDRDACWRVNSMGPHHLADGCARRGKLLIHVSCDAVFGADNTKLAMLADVERLAGLGFCTDDVECRYDEDSPCGPVDYYGMTKLAGEHAILRAAANHPGFRYWIIRPGSLFEHPWRTGRSYFWQLAAMVQSRTKKIHVPSDVLMSLCYVPELANAIDWMVERRWDRGEDDFACATGVYHMANEGPATWYQVANQMARSLSGGTDSIIPVSLATYRTKMAGVMPAINVLSRYRVLSTGRYTALGGPQFTHWTEAVDKWCVAMGGSSLAVA
jgi:dTDP-4-dehydrorhamnose reductase